MKPRAIIMNDYMQHDFGAAEHWGRLEVLIRGKINIFVPDSMVRLRERVRERLNELQPTEADYLVISGHALLNVIVINEWLQRFGQVRLLIYGARHNDYVERILTDHWGMTPPDNEGERSP